jgi:UDP-3-O-[3-hydroxymyristoyl] glucosamine N-acyltransferase
MLGGMVGIAGHLEICDDVAVTGRTAVFKSISKPGAYSGSLWADDAKHFHRNAARFNRLEELARRVRRLEGGRGSTEQGGSDE